MKEIIKTFMSMPPLDGAIILLCFGIAFLGLYVYLRIIMDIIKSKRNL